MAINDEIVDTGYSSIERSVLKCPICLTNCVKLDYHHATFGPERIWSCPLCDEVVKKHPVLAQWFEGVLKRLALKYQKRS